MWWMGENCLKVTEMCLNDDGGGDEKVLHVRPKRCR